MSHAATYRVAELATRVDELRNPRMPLSRSQLADLADRAWRDASSLTSDAITRRSAAGPAGWWRDNHYAFSPYGNCLAALHRYKRDGGSNEPKSQLAGDYRGMFRL